MGGGLGSVVAAVSVAGVLGLAGAPAQGARTGPCTSGKTRVRIGKKAACVAAGSVLPSQAPASLTSGSLVVRQLLGGAAQAPFVHALPAGKLSKNPLADSQVVPDLGVLSAHVESFGAKSNAYPSHGSSVTTLDELAAPAGGITYSENGITATSNGSSISVHGSANLGDARGYQGTLNLTGTIPLDKSGKPLDSAAVLEFGVDVASKSSSAKGGVHVRLGMTDGLKFAAPCPSAAGYVDAKERLNVNVDSQSTNSGGLDYVRSHTTIDENGAWHGTVDTDAKLQRIDFTDSLNVDYGRSAAVGPIQVLQSAVTTINAAGSIDGPSGRVSLSTFTVEGHADASGIGSGAFESNFAASLNSASALAELKQLMTDALHFKWERFKAAEEEWRKENACAKIVFDPESDPQLAPGTKVEVSGRVLSKDGKPSDSKWAAPRFDVGSLGSGLPGSTSAGSPIKFSVVGGGPSGTNTVTLTERATSRAGVATAPWHATFGGWKVVIGGAVSAQQTVFATVASNPSATVQVTYQTVGGVSGYHGASAFSYTTPSVTPLAGAPCGYALSGSIAGTVNVNIKPSADGRTIAAQFFLVDNVPATVTCPMAPPQPLGGALVGTVNFQSPNPTLTFPADTASDQPLNWNLSSPFPANGRLTIHVEPLTS